MKPLLSTVLGGAGIEADVPSVVWIAVRLAGSSPQGVAALGGAGEHGIVANLEARKRPL
jgi:hypothetical protein